jgi:hypothetical protein
VSILRGMPMGGRPDLYRGEGETIFWEVMSFFGPKPPEIGLRGALRRLVGQGRIAEAYITALHWDAHFDPGPEELPAPPRPRASERPLPRPKVDEPSPADESWRRE